MCLLPLNKEVALQSATSVPDTAPLLEVCPGKYAFVCTCVPVRTVL